MKALKTTVFVLTLLIFPSFLFSQVIFKVLQPPSLAGVYDLTYAKPQNGWGVNDLTDPANSVTDTLAFVSDGTSADSLGCNALVNGPSVRGKIAVVYRGTCEFGTKALNAQNEGAVAVIIINNVPGAPTEMGGGVDGPNDTIPVIMITQATGQLLKNEIQNGNVVAFIGNKAGMFANDVRMTNGDVVRSRFAGVIDQLVKNPGEYSVDMGAWITNIGSQDQNSVILTATVVYNGDTIYNQSSTPDSIISQDSLFISLPTLNTTFTPGNYQVLYTANIGVADEDTTDNYVVADFQVGNQFSYAPLDTNFKVPLRVADYKPVNAFDYEQCIFFKNSFASRVVAEGMTFAFAHQRDLTNQFVQINAYEWNDNFTDLNDPNFPSGTFNITNVGSGQYIYLGDYKDSMIYVPFTSPIALVNNQKYLFCVQNFVDSMYLAYNTNYDYTTNVNVYLQPISPIYVGGSTNRWYALGFGTDIVPAISVKMSIPNSINDLTAKDNTLVPSPNPASEFISIPLKNLSGKGKIEIYSLDGKLVESFNNINLDNDLIKINISKLNNGLYNFKLITNNKVIPFKVSINK